MPSFNSKNSLLGAIACLFVLCSGVFAQKFIDPKNFDLSVKPTDDFHQYANGMWMKNNPIPESERAWGIGNLVQEETYARVKNILEEASKSKSPAGSNEQKIGDFYFTGKHLTLDKLPGTMFRAANTPPNLNNYCN